MTVSVKEGASRNVLRGIVQYDTLNEVNIRLSDGSKAFNYDGYTNIVLKVLKADGTAYVNSKTDKETKIVATSPVDGIVTVILAGQATTAAGICQSVIEIYDGSEVLTTARFNYEVFEGLNLDDAVESSTEYPILNNLIADVSALEAAIEAAEAARVKAEAARADEASGYVALAEQLAARAEQLAAQARESAADAHEAAAEAQAIVDGDYATNAGSQAYTNSQIGAHNTNTAAHADIRTLIANANTAIAAAQAVANAAQTAAAAAKVAADNAATAAATAQTTANGKAPASHNHAAGNITSGIIPVERGGTGVATIAELAAALSASIGGVRVTVGNYTGSGGTSGTSSKTITLPFTPNAVLVVNQKGVVSTVVNTWSYVYGGLALAGYPAKFKSFEFITIGTNSFTVKSDNGATEAGTNIVCNSSAESYNYIAIG